MCGYRINVSFFALSSLLSVSFSKLNRGEKRVKDEKNFKTETYVDTCHFEHKASSFSIMCITMHRKKEKIEINSKCSKKTMHRALNTKF